MTALINWIKTNKLASFLILVIFFLSSRSLFPSFSPLRIVDQSAISGESYMRGVGTDGGLSLGAPAYKTADYYIPPVEPNTPPQAGVGNRMVVQESNLSLVVKDVRQSVNQIIDRAGQTGGYMVSSTLNQPEEAPYATVVIRIPGEKLNETLEYYRSLAVKVSSENLLGRDVTDEYLDINTRLERLRRTQVKFEELLDQAVKFEDILRAQQEVLNLQNQIDSLLGQQQYLEQTAKLAKLTIHLSTDELALPYAPSDTFRPAVVFKLAVRSLMLTLRSWAATAIWIGVYAIIWIPGLIILLIILRWWQKKQTPR